MHQALAGAVALASAAAPRISNKSSQTKLSDPARKCRRIKPSIKASLSSQARRRRPQANPDRVRTPAAVRRANTDCRTTN